MAAFQWTDNLSVEVRHLDEHHQKLLVLLSQLYESMRLTEGRQVVGRILVELVRYAQYHFHAEEELMERHDFPDYRRHKAEHQAFIAKSTQLYHQSQKGEPVVARTYEFMKMWLIEHINQTDKRYSSFFLAKGVK